MTGDESDDQWPVVMCAEEDVERMRVKLRELLDSGSLRVQSSPFVKPGTAYVINPEGLLPWTT